MNGRRAWTWGSARVLVDLVVSGLREHVLSAQRHSEGNGIVYYRQHQSAVDAAKAAHTSTRLYVDTSTRPFPLHGPKLTRPQVHTSTPHTHIRTIAHNTSTPHFKVASELKQIITLAPSDVLEFITWFITRTLPLSTSQMVYQSKLIKISSFRLSRFLSRKIE